MNKIFSKTKIYIFLLSLLLIASTVRAGVWIYSNSRQSQVLELPLLLLAPIPNTIYFGDSYTLTVTTNPIQANQEIMFLMNDTSVANATTNASGMASVIYQPPVTGYYNFTAKMFVP